ncbi:DUF2914 domain-containing protein [Subsaximicrobium wynnwilliamsii]|uniref:DUF2914 domain-containing protein n=1 Tax=Subsaximicrobium wynnwilliamsii TaxID=291179 RepID=A0A5C6ZFV3_9FLAO|nr:DUF2914 domain-containing protein [Subsaximicrobium wynnwilliamsii]TXD83032.1 DUF2914 domain-containing protein [Subsaximicrobium wynnwilliamsii]TXD88776.1 DUF2914 domain-containing protein [Subsaximicrobium wynnwilliamsii]TXE02849.1 DUF2914 domain-containing protein [Subsaximicrobium wynnwilliamsii]
MKRTLVKFRNSDFRQFITRHQKYAPILFFIGGFIFDTLTLGRIDRIYDISVLCLHMTSLTITLYLFNIMEDGKLRNTIFERFEPYFPLAIQFFFGGLSSAYVVYFSRSVSLSKTITFFIILVLLLFANELLKKRISNKYLQFTVYFFISFTFFTFMLPVLFKEMNTAMFIISGLVSLGSTLTLIIFIYSRSQSTRLEINLAKLLGMVFIIYGTINVFYFFNMIPPVPLAMETGLVAHSIEIKNNKYEVSYERDEWYVFWRQHNSVFTHHPGENVYVFSSIFAPTDLKKAISHRWGWLNPDTNTWEIFDDIGFEMTGGRDNGFRGYTFKNNVKDGTWKVEVITEEGLVLGVIDFEIKTSASDPPIRMITRKF